jgi:hypothetical protein
MPSERELETYEVDGAPGPSLPHLQLDWTLPFRGKGCSRWNQDAITLLATAIQAQLGERNDLSPKEISLDLMSIEKAVASKLGRTKTRIRQMVLLDEMGTEARNLSIKSLDLKSSLRRQADRVSSRRQAVGVRVLLNVEITD